MLKKALALPVLFGLSTGFLFAILIFYLIGVGEWVEKTDQLIAQSHKTLQLVADAESGLQGYTITGEPQYLDTYRSSVQRISHELEKLRELSLGSSSAMLSQVEIPSTFQQWRNHADRIVATPPGSGEQAGRLEKENRATMDILRSQFEQLSQTEQMNRAARGDFARDITRFLLFFMMGVGIAGGSTLAIRSRGDLLEISDNYERLLKGQENTLLELRDSRERLSMALDAACIGTYDWDRRGDIVIWNPYHETLFGYEPGQPQRSREDFLARLSPEMQEYVTRTYQEAFKNKSNFDIEFWIHLPDGSTRWVHSRGRPIYDSQGKPYRLMGTVTDITQRKRHEEYQRNLQRWGEVLARSLDYEKTLLAISLLSVPDLADWCVIDIVTDDNQIRRVLAHHHNDNLDELVQVLCTHPPSIESNHPIAQAVRSGEYRLVQGLMNWAQGETGIDRETFEILRRLNFNSALCVPLVGRGRTIGALTLFSGSEGQMYTEDKVNLVKDLAHRAALAVDNAQLYAEAQRASEAKSRFLANVSHEIRTPLGVILGFTDMALSGHHDSAELIDHFKTIKRNGEALLKLIGDVLDLSKIEAEKLETEKVSFSLPELIEEVINSLKVQADQKNIHLGLRTEGPLPASIRSDPTRLRQILVNVIGNSIKFTERGRVDISVRTISGKEEFLAFDVADTGIGLSAEQQSLLFKPFSQADTSTTRKFGGTGLGLALAKRLAQALGGDLVLVHSEKGKGSTFSFHIAIEKVSEEPRLTPLIPAATPDGVLHGLSVLVVDDSNDNQIIVNRFLSDAGARVIAAYDGQEGVAKTLSLLPDVVLMDIQMPVLDGYEATRTLREAGYRGPIVALTANSLMSERDRALKGGFTDFLVKPIDRKQLIEKFGAYLRRAS